jgi:hypothetical protein
MNITLAFSALRELDGTTSIWPFGSTFPPAEPTVIKYEQKTIVAISLTGFMVRITSRP